MFKAAGSGEGGSRKKNERSAETRNTDGTAAWFKQTETNSRAKKIRQSLFNTKNSNAVSNCYEAAMCPQLDAEDEAALQHMDPEEAEHQREQYEHEWVAENLVDFYQEINMIYDLLSYKNDEWAQLIQTPEKLKNKGYPEGVTYKWKVRVDTPPQELGVEDYVKSVLEWIEHQMMDEDIFPTDSEVTFRADFITKHARKMFQRMFRVLAVMLVNPVLSKVGIDNEPEETKSLLKLFKRFLCFATYWNLVDPREVYSVEYSEAVLKQYESAKKEFDRNNKNRRH